MKTSILMTLCMSLLACGTDLQAPGALEEVETGASVSAAIGGPPEWGTTPGPTCGGAQCYLAGYGSTQHALLATTNGLGRAVSAHASQHAAGKFLSNESNGINAVTSGTDSSAVYARSLATSGSGGAVHAMATGTSGRPLRITNPAGGALLEARAGSTTFRIEANGDMTRNGVVLGRRGPKGPKGPTGNAGARGATGNPGPAGRTSVYYACAQETTCIYVCNGDAIMAEANGSCDVGETSNGCSWGGTDGVCCACAP